MKILLLLLFYILLPISGLADPLISAVTVHGVPVSTITTGQTITIKGLGFGPGTLALLWDDFESGKSGAPLAPSPKVGTWSIGTNPVPVYSTLHAHSGSKSSRAYAPNTNGNTRSQFSVWNLSFNPGRRHYVSFWYWFDYVSSPGKYPVLKVHQLWGPKGCWRSNYNPGVYSGDGGNEEWRTAIDLFGREEDRSYWYFHPQKQKWSHFELIAQESSANTADGSLIILIDGIKRFERQRVKTRLSDDCYWKSAHFFYGLMFCKEAEWYIDDVYMADSWLRVELGDEPGYKESLHREILPATSWNQEEITGIVNPGSFRLGSDVFLYVTDSEGRVNQKGYKLRLNRAKE